MIVLYTLLYLYIFYLAFVLVMGVRRAQLSGRLTPASKALLIVPAIVGVLMDFITQYTFATLLFWDLPASGERMVTSRLQRYVALGEEKGTWRYRWAKSICDSILDPFDPSGNHC